MNSLSAKSEPEKKPQTTTDLDGQSRIKETTSSSTPLKSAVPPAMEHPGVSALKKQHLQHASPSPQGPVTSDMSIGPTPSRSVSHWALSGRSMSRRRHHRTFRQFSSERGKVIQIQDIS